MSYFRTRDVKVDVRCNLRARGCRVEVTHLPTGLTAECGDWLSRSKNEAVAMERLEQKVREAKDG